MMGKRLIKLAKGIFSLTKKAIHPSKFALLQELKALLNKVFANLYPPFKFIQS
jgi:hypothetical protein